MARTIQDIIKIYKMKSMQYIFTAEVMSLYNSNMNISFDESTFTTEDLDVATDAFIYRICFAISNCQEVYQLFMNQDPAIRLELYKRHKIMLKCLSKINPHDANEMAEMSSDDNDIIIDILINGWRTIDKMVKEKLRLDNFMAN